MQSSPECVRPRTSEYTTTMSSGLGGGVAVGDVGDVGGCIVCADGVPRSMAGVFPVGELEGQNNTHELEAAVEEEE